MTTVTIQTIAIRGKITLQANEDNPHEFIASGSQYKDMAFQADTLGDAVNMFMANIHRLQRNDEAKAASMAKSIRMRKIQEDRKKDGKQIGRPPVVPNKNPPVARTAS